MHYIDSQTQDMQTMLVHTLVEQQVLQTPEAIAVTFEGQQITYRELNQQANQLAHYLQKLGVGPDVLVGVCVERSLEMIVGLLAILKAGGAYVPLDPTYPQERLAYMLENANAQVLLTQSWMLPSLPEPTARHICLDTDWTEIAKEQDTNCDSEADAENLAYVIYTSGSTGKPKGVAMPHRPLMNLLTWQLADFKRPHARTLQFTPISFDVSFQEIFSTLAFGGTLVLISDSKRRDMESLLCYISEQGIERLFLPFVALQHLAETAKTQMTLPVLLQEVITAGEQLKITNSIAQWFSRLGNCTLYNQYGPSESHVVTSYKLSDAPQHWPQLPPIGVPIANTQIYLLDPKSRRKDDPVKLAAQGEPGELAISGVALARGYLNQPELTESKFIPNPFSDEPEARLYRTGDLVRYCPDGDLEYIERIDNQVKIRGTRIELGEIEVSLSEHPMVKDAVVVAREDETGNPYLSAYVVKNNTEFSGDLHELVSQLRTFLKQKLPNCMIPSTFELMENFPLTPSGKVDRRALPEPSQVTLAPAKEYTSPRNPIEEKLVEIWSQVLLTAQMGIDENFFESGGDSLRAIQLVFKTREIFQIELPIIALFDAPTIAQYAERVKAAIASSTISTSDDISIAALEAETSLDASVVPGTMTIDLAAEPENIFITGVTGFLGAFLLRELLAQTPAQIHCLVRANSIRAGKDKIDNNLRKYLLWDEALASRIVPILGDLAQPLLGVTEEHFNELANKIDVIYHNGASINLIYPYSALRTANVLGTQELLKLATSKRVKPVHFISTLDVFQNSRAFSSAPIKEDDELNPAEAIHFDGYTKSKWVSEQMIHIAQSRGLPASIYRPAMITGHSKTGAANVNDLMNRLIKGFVQLGSAPSFDMVVNVAPVDYFSVGAVYLSRQPESIGKAFNFINPQPVSMRRFVEVINECGYPVRQVSHQEWEDLLIHHIATLDGVVSVLTSKVSETSLSYLERSSVGADQVSCSNVISGLKETSIFCPSIDSRLLKKYFSFFRDIGFLDVSTNDSEPTPLSLV
jgi:amino acid adenylation domain-containing protein/thioester reductase-like protein